MIQETVKTTVKEVKREKKDAGLKNILVVENERLVLSLISKSLSIYLKDFNILTVENGEEAVEILKSHQVVFIVIDLNMPIMNGYELLGYLKKNYPDTPVFLMTSDLTSEVEERLRLMGVRQVFAKPFSLRTLALKTADELKNEFEVCTHDETSSAIALEG